MGGGGPAGGGATRLDGADKAALEHEGRTLLEHALGALGAASEIVVVGSVAPTSRPVTFTRETPPGGGPFAGLSAGVAALRGSPDLVVVLAVDMPHVTADTVARLVRAARRTPSTAPGWWTRPAAASSPAPSSRRWFPRPGKRTAYRCGGSWSTNGPSTWAAGPRGQRRGHLGGRRPAARRRDRSRATGRTDLNTRPGFARLAREPPRLDRRAVRRPRHRDRGGRGAGPRPRESGRRQRGRKAAPITTYLLGYAAGSSDADVEEIERLAANAQAWPRAGTTRPARRTPTTSRTTSPTTAWWTTPATSTVSAPEPGTR